MVGVLNMLNRDKIGKNMKDNSRMESGRAEAKWYLGMEQFTKDSLEVEKYQVVVVKFVQTVKLWKRIGILLVLPSSFQIIIDRNLFIFNFNLFIK